MLTVPFIMAALTYAMAFSTNRSEGYAAVSCDIPEPFLTNDFQSDRAGIFGAIIKHIIRIEHDYTRSRQRHCATCNLPIGSIMFMKSFGSVLV